jgi:hypothetical protein
VPDRINITCHPIPIKNFHKLVQIRHNGRVTEGLFAGRPLGEKIGRDPKKGQPLSDRVILMSFREWR